MSTSIAERFLRKYDPARVGLIARLNLRATAVRIITRFEFRDRSALELTEFPPNRGEQNELKAEWPEDIYGTTGEYPVRVRTE